jgi:magnesium-transporting ATPase (P-type)
MSLMPGLKYPPNPPAVGNPETIGYRTGLYFVMMLLSIGIVIAAAWLSHQLTPRLGRGNAMMWATLFAVALMLVVCALMPTVNEVLRPLPGGPAMAFPYQLLRHASGALERHRCGVRCFSRTHADDTRTSPSLPARLTT